MQHHNQQKRKQWPLLVQLRRVRKTTSTSVILVTFLIVVIVTLLCPGSTQAAAVSGASKRKRVSSSAMSSPADPMLPEEPLIDQIAMESVDNFSPLTNPSGVVAPPQNFQRPPAQPPAYTGFKINPNCKCGKSPYSPQDGTNPHPWTAAIFYRNPKRTVISVAGEDPSEDFRRAVEGTDDEGEIATSSDLKPAMLLFCTGSLINDRYVLTASRCVKGLNATDLEVWLADKPIWSDNQQKAGRESSANDEQHVQKSAIERIILHPDFDPSVINHEIALLQLSSPVKFSRPVPTSDQKRRGDKISKFFTAPICLPKYDVMKKIMDENKEKGQKKKGGDGDHSHNHNPEYIHNLKGTVVSWDKKGRTSYSLVQKHVPFVNGIGMCMEMTKKKAVLNENMFCAGNMTQGAKDSCSMDTGSPLVLFEDGQEQRLRPASIRDDTKGHYTLVGISSWLYGCTNLTNVNILYDVIFPNNTAKPQVPGVYLRVAEYLDWVTHKTLDAVWCS